MPVQRKNTLDTTLPGVISVNSASDALRITQTGAGNCLVVEDSANPDSTPVVISASGQMALGKTTATAMLDIRLGGSNINVTNDGNLILNRTAYGGINVFRNQRTSGTEAAPTIVVSGDELVRLEGRGYDGATQLTSASIAFWVDGTPGTNDMPGRIVFSTTADGAASPTERMRINSSGNIGIGADAGMDSSLVISKNFTGATTAYGTRQLGTIQSGVTSSVFSILSSPATVAAAFTLSNLFHVHASQGSIGAGSAITNQYGFHASSNLIGATANYGFYSAVPSGSNRWGFYGAGTARNWFAGDLTIQGSTAIPAGGTAGAGYLFSSTANFGVFFGSGTPTLSAAKGSLYLRSDGTADGTSSDRLYVNNDGSTGWTVIRTGTT